MNIFGQARSEGRASSNAAFTQRDRIYSRILERTKRAAYSKGYERAQILKSENERARKIVENYEQKR
ncbi:hypothetical protein P8X24_09805 [Pyrococcus kukulkanii]|uniref:hypothetical protein n=1 Tax=Pyrococcus kukulkanii TaxID=1609559 RepID=UPI003563901D